MYPKFNQFAWAHMVVSTMFILNFFFGPPSLLIYFGALFVNLVVIICLADDLLMDYRRRQWASKTTFYKPRETRGFVYLMESDIGLYKIGHSVRPKDRLNKLRAQSPINIKLLHTIKYADRFAAELMWHKRFASKRVKGEWFKLDADDVKSFTTVRGALPTLSERTAYA